MVSGRVANKNQTALVDADGTNSSYCPIVPALLERPYLDVETMRLPSCAFMEPELSTTQMRSGNATLFFSSA